MVTLLRKFLYNGLNFCLPPRCLSCYELSTDPHGLCVKCWQKLDFISDPFCKKCGAPFEFKIGGDLICAPCLNSPPEFDCARASVIYTPESRHLLLAFKHGDMLQASKILARWMVTSGKDLIDSVDLIAPVPLHPLRLFLRQYNQSAILCNEISRLTGREKKNNLLKRNRYTSSQGQKKHKERQKNVKAAFTVNLPHLVQGRNILIIDDVMTTGATVNECAKALKKGGASKVNVLTFAHVLRSDRGS